MEHWEPDGTHTFCSNGTRAAAALLSPDFRGEFEALVSGESVRLRVDEAGVGLRLPEGEAYGLVGSPLDLEYPHALGWTGTPHLVIEVPDVEGIHLPSFAPPLRFHPDLPEGANVSILQRLDSGEAKIRSWERGVEGETLCCGQGCAVGGAWLAQRTGIHHWKFQPAGEDPVRVELGDLQAGKWAELWLSGPVRRIGRFDPDRALIRELG
jgi:diaminopimelate epimerase